MAFAILAWFEFLRPRARARERKAQGFRQFSAARDSRVSRLLYALFYSHIGWRGMLWLGVLPALSVFYVRKLVKEPPIWVENRRRQRVEQREMKVR